MLSSCLFLSICEWNKPNLFKPVKYNLRYSNCSIGEIKETPCISVLSQIKLKGKAACPSNIACNCIWIAT